MKSGEPRGLGGALWRLSEWLLGDDLSEEVLGDLVEERSERARGDLWLGFRAARLALGIRLRFRPASASPASGFGSPVSAAVSELRHAERRLRQAPLFSALTVGTLSLGSAASLCVFVVVQGVLLQPLDFDRPEELVAVFTTERDGAELRNPSSAADFLDWRDQAADLAQLAAAEYWSPAFGATEAEARHRRKIVGLHVTRDLLGMLGVQPRRGRLFEPGDDEQTVVISWRTWQRRLGGREDVIGEEIFLDGRPHTIVGVMPETFAFPPFWATDAELWAPLQFETEPSRGGRRLRVFGRLSGEITVTQLDERLATVQAGLAAIYPETHRGTGARAESLREPVVSGSRDALRLLVAGALLVIALMTTNLAGLLLARAMERRTALATQAALGASRRRLALGVVLESVLLLSVAGVLGVGLSFFLLEALQSFGDSIPRLDDVRITWQSAVGAAFGLSLLGLVVGSIPGLRAATLSDGGLRRATSDVQRTDAWRRWLVAAEVAMTTTLLLLAGWVGRSFDRLSAEDLGFETASVLGVTAELEESSKGQQLDLLLETLEQHPDIASVGAVNHLPLAGDLWRGQVFGVGISSPDDDVRAALRVATPGYFDAMSMRLRSGRLFDASDRREGQPVVLINRSLADTLWPGQEAVGQILAPGSLDEDSPRLLVIGVLENVKQAAVDEATPPEIYQPYSQDPFPWSPSTTLVLRSRIGQRLSAQELETTLARAVPGLALGTPVSLRDVVADDLNDERVRTAVLGLFAALSVLLAAVGLFGVVAFAAEQRRKEFGLRIALGSWSGSIAWLLVKEGAVLAALGAGLGGLGALSLAPRLDAVLFETSTLDLGVWLGVVGVVVALTVAASLPTAVRASRSHPASVLDRR